MGKKITVAILIIIAFLIIGGAIFYFGGTPVVRLDDVPLETVKKDFHGGIATAKNAVIKGETEWATLWNQMSANITPQPPVPEIDFTNKMVIGVFMGVKPTGGYSTEVTRIAESENKITVYVREISPGPNCRVTEALTNPYHIVTVDASSKQVDFSVTKDITECPAP